MKACCVFVSTPGANLCCRCKIVSTLIENYFVGGMHTYVKIICHCCSFQNCFVIAQFINHFSFCTIHITTKCQYHNHDRETCNHDDVKISNLNFQLVQNENDEQNDWRKIISRCKNIVSWLRYGYN